MDEWMDEMKVQKAEYDLYINMVNCPMTNVAWTRQDGYKGWSKVTDIADDVWNHNMRCRKIISHGAVLTTKQVRPAFIIAFKEVDKIYDDYYKKARAFAEQLSQEWSEPGARETAKREWANASLADYKVERHTGKSKRHTGCCNILMAFKTALLEKLAL